jgi:excisionase family DNA binding protein
LQIGRIFPNVVVVDETATKEPLAYTVRQTAELLGVSARTIYNLIDNKTLPVIVLGGRRLIPRRAIDRLIAEADPTGEPA